MKKCLNNLKEGVSWDESYQKSVENFVQNCRIIKPPKNNLKKFANSFNDEYIFRKRMKPVLKLQEDLNKKKTVDEILFPVIKDSFYKNLAYNTGPIAEENEDHAISPIKYNLLGWRSKKFLK